jgi:cytochrome c556
MNLARFHGAVWSLKLELEELEIPQLLNQLHQALNQSIAQPNPQTASAFKTRLSGLSERLERCPSNEATPSRRKVFDQLGAADKTGLGLLDRITNIIYENTITPADALRQIDLLSKEVKAFQDTVIALGSGLDELNVEYDDLDENEVEVGITIPEVVLRGHLANCQKELGCIDELMKVLSEVATGDVQHAPIRTIGSTDMEVFLQVGGVVGACVATTIERIVALYRQQLEIKKIKLEIERMQMPEKVSKPFDDHVKDVVEKALAEIAKDLLKQFYKKRDGGRKNELQTHLKKVLAYMAERIDRGASFEVRAGVQEKPEEPQEENEEAQVEHQKALEAFERANDEKAKLNAAGRSVTSLPPRKDEIFLLPEPYKPENEEGPIDGANKAMDGDEK